MAPLSPHETFVDLIAGMERADPARGLHLFDARFQESWHPYRALFARIQVLARRFHEQGIEPGHKVQIPLATDPDAFCSFMALVWLGAVPYSVTAPLLGQDRDAHRRRMADLIARYGVDRLLVSEDLSGIAGAFSEVPREMELDPGVVTDDDLARAERVAPVSAAPEDVAFVQFSSGSTSHPKGVTITHRGIVENVAIIATNDHRTSENVWVSWLPLYHDMGLIGGLLSNLHFPNDAVLMHPRCFLTRPVSWLAAITRFRGYVTAIPNFALDICTERIPDEQLEQFRIDLSTFRYIYNGAEPVRPRSIRRFEERFAPYGFVPGSIYPVYGMSETTLMVSAPSFDEPEVVRRIADMDVPAVGYPVGDFRVRIVDDAGGDVASGEIGEILIRGTCVTPGYLDGAANAESIEDGWLRTGDLGSLDGNGRLYVTGRKKDLIIFQGKNFYGHEIAAAIADLPLAKSGHVYVFGVDVDGRERVVVLMTPAKAVSGDGAPPSSDEIRNAVRRHVLLQFGLPVDDVQFVPRIPKTTSGKVSRHLCEQIYRDALSAGSGSAAAPPAS